MSITRDGKSCSFCATSGGPGTDVRLFGGLGAQVCASCVEDFHDVLGDKTQLERASGASPWDRMTDAEVLATLPQILASAEQNLAFAHEWVDMIRERGISWAEIGRALGVSRQAAWERFARKSKDTSATA